MTCKQLGGACNVTFSATTFEEITELSKQQGMEMFQKQDAAHIREMQELMKSPKVMQQWFADCKKEFEAL